jgi:hypothetical protein
LDGFWGELSIDPPNSKKQSLLPPIFHVAVFALFLALMLAHGVARLPAQTTNSAPALDDNVVIMQKIEVRAARFNWTHARSAHFEILSNLNNTKFVADVVRKAEQIITLYEEACPAIFSPRLDLLSKLIFIEDETVERFFSQAGVGSTLVDFNERMVGTPFHKNTRQFDNRYKISALANHNDEQLVIVKFLTKAYMSDGKNWHEKPIECAADLAITHLYECARIRTNGKKLPWLVAALNGMRGHPGGGSFRMRPAFSYKVYGSEGRFYRSGWISVNDDNTITLGRYCLNCEADAVESAIDFPSDSPQKQRKLWANFMRAPDVGLGDVFNNTFVSPGLDGAAIQRQLTMQREVRDFLYYCLFGPDINTPRAFANFVRVAAATETIDETLFKNCFNAGYDEFKDRMYAFFKTLSKNNHAYDRNPWGPTGLRVALSPNAIPSKPVKLSRSWRADTTRIISDWFDVCNAPASARDSLLKACAESPEAAGDLQFIATLGLNEARYGDRLKAISLLEKAARAEIPRPGIYRTLTRLYFEDILERKGADYRLTATEFRDVLAPLSIAFGLPQANPQNYIIFATVWEHADIKPAGIKSADIKSNMTYRNTIIEGCQRFPDNIDMLESILPRFAKRGFKTEAVTLAGQSAQNPLPSEKRQQLDRLMEKLGIH